MALNAHQRHELKKLITELGKYRGRHTELVSVYIPAGYDMNNIINHIAQEAGTASNIKSTSTRKNVEDALSKMMQHLRLYKRTPEHGLAAFAGNVAEREGQSNVRVWSIEPPIPIKTRLYRCDKAFVIEILEDMLNIKEFFGLVVMDRRDATIALLKGKTIVPLVKTHSEVPGKMRAGGQCLSKDSLIMLNDGNIIEIKDSHNPLKVVSASLNEQKISIADVKGKWENKQQFYKLTTKFPKLQIKASSNHTFFIRGINKIEEKPLSSLKRGDYLIMPEKISVNPADQKIEFTPKITKRTIKLPTIPDYVNPEFARILGYYLGDGNYEIDRISFSEQREEVALYYKNLVEKIFGIQATIRKRETKGYYQIRVGSRLLAQLFKEIFGNENKTLKGKIPEIILKSSNASLAAFIAGFFDAEGYISSHLALGINNEIITKQLQFSLLRLGIISSIYEYDNRKNPYSKKIRYTLTIDDLESIKRFADEIGFIAKEKSNKLDKFLNARSDRSNTRQILVNGSEVRELFRNKKIVYKYGLSGFFSNKRQLNKTIFKERLIDSIEDSDLKNKLQKYYNSELIPVKIDKIEYIGKDSVVDIETSSHNFFANCLLVHNSAQRFEQNRELAAKAHYKKVAEYMKEQFLNLEGLKGIIIGGPGPTKYDLVEGNFITADVKKKIIAIKDVTYTDEFGLQEMLERCDDVFANEEIMTERKIMNLFFLLLAKHQNKTSYGLKEVKKRLEQGVVDTLLLSEELDDTTINELESIALQFNSKVELISTETREGQQLRDLGKVAAILRYEVHEE